MYYQSSLEENIPTLESQALAIRSTIRSTIREECTPPSQHLLVRRLGRLPYETVWPRMTEFTNNRDDNTADELWLVEHPPIFTLGQAGRLEHVLSAGDIPVVHSDRGGQVTYHGPGQLVAYPLVNLSRRKLGIREFVTRLESIILNTLAHYGVTGNRKDGAPGVYVGDAKIAALGLRVRRGCSFHGISLNVAMDLKPFAGINPCGFIDLKVVQLQDYVDDEGGRDSVTVAAAGQVFSEIFSEQMQYRQVNFVENE